VNELSHAKAALLGVIQGLTEFLPVSSSGHLALAQRWLALDPRSPQMLLFDVLVHVATLVAVGIVFAAPASAYIHRLLKESRRSWRGRRYAWGILLMGAVATVPTAAFGLMFKETFEAAFDRPAWIGTCLIVTGVMLGVTILHPRQARGWKEFRWWQAGLVGIAQALAILPGISRSGSTICVAGYCGLRRRWAAEFSFLIAAPAIAGATILKLRDTLKLPPEQFAELPWGAVIVGAVVSLVVGVLALRLLLDTVRRAKLHYFAPYCWLVGALVLAGSG
jgi:undecaprenyl-diphosphatase